MMDGWMNGRGWMDDDGWMLRMVGWMVGMEELMGG